MKRLVLLLLTGAIVLTGCRAGALERNTPATSALTSPASQAAPPPTVPATNPGVVVAPTQEVPVPETPGPSVPVSPVLRDITPAEATALIEANRGNPDFVIMDVRTPTEFTEEGLEGAVNIDYRSPAFRDELNKLDKSKSYLVYCRSGVRSRSAVDIMAELGFREVYNLVGGITQWEAEDQPVRRG